MSRSGKDGEGTMKDRGGWDDEVFTGSYPATRKTPHPPESSSSVAHSKALPSLPAAPTSSTSQQPTETSFLLPPRDSSSNSSTQANIEADWVSSASSSGESSSAIQRKTVRRQFPVGSPRRARGSATAIITGASGSSNSTSRSRKASSQSGAYGASPPPLIPRMRTPTRAQHAGWQDDATPRPLHKARQKPGIDTSGPSFLSLAMQSLRPLRTLVSLLASILGLVLSPVQQALSSFILLGLIIVSSYYMIRSPLQSLASHLLPAGTMSTLLLSPFYLVSPRGLMDAYCSTIGIGCEADPLPVARLARTVSDQAVKAHDIFQSVVALGSPDSLGLHHVDIWELGVAVKASSGLENKDHLGNDLMELGHLTRDVKDSMTSLNSKGINAFSWTLHSFSRIEKTIELLQSKGTRYKPSDVSRQLDDLFTQLAEDLGSLLNDISTVIPVSQRASDLGGRVMFEIGREHSKLNELRETTPLWRRLLDASSFASRQLSRDLQLTGDSVLNLKTTRRSLEEARGFLINYRDQVAYFKASLVGFHAADHGLDPEDEVATLRAVMQAFATSVEEAKTGKSAIAAPVNAGGSHEAIDRLD